MRILKVSLGLSLVILVFLLGIYGYKEYKINTMKTNSKANNTGSMDLVENTSKESSVSKKSLLEFQKEQGEKEQNEDELSDDEISDDEIIDDKKDNFPDNGNVEEEDANNDDIQEEVVINSGNGFLDNYVGMTYEEVVSLAGTPNNESSSYGYSIYYYDVNIMGMLGKISIDFRNRLVESAFWDLNEGTASDYISEIKKITEYFNDNYLQVEQTTWQDGSTELGLVGLSTNNGFRILFQD